MDVEAMSGLFSKGADASRVPLKAVAVTGRIDGFFCEVTVEQTYANEGTAPIEAVYRFPLPEGAAVSGFEAEVAGRRVVGAVREKEAAAEEYGRAIARGGGGYLLEEDAADVFTASVGNLPPGGRCALRITYAAELPCGADGVVRFSLPTTVAPRYTPASPRAGGGDAAPDVQPLAVAADVPYRMSAALEVEMPSDVAAVASPSHPAAFQAEISGRTARVRLTRDQPLDGAFVIEIAQREPHAARAWAERGPDGTVALAVALCPEWGEDEEARAEYLFLVDRSGSMEGSKIEQSKNALQLMLRSLPVGSRFNVLGFGDLFVRLFDESRGYDDASIAAAAAHVADIGADLGGTELLPVLEAIFAGPPDPLFPRQIFLLTDGEVSNTEQVIRLVRRHAAEARVFSVGIGSGASEHLVRGVARAGGGQAEFIGDGERVERAVLRQLRRAAQPSLAAPALDWGSPSAQQAPHALRPCFLGDRLVVYAVLPPGPAPPPAVSLRAQRRAGPVELSVPVPAAREAGSVWRLAGRAAVRDLQEGASALHGRDGALLAGRTEAEVSARVLEVALRHGVTSSRTAFVAVEERPGAAPASEPMRLSVVPTLLPRGEAPEYFAVGAAACPAPCAAAPPGMFFARSSMREECEDEDEDCSGYDLFGDGCGAPAAQAPQAPPPPPPPPRVSAPKKKCAPMRRMKMAAAPCEPEPEAELAAEADEEMMWDARPAPCPMPPPPAPCAMAPCASAAPAAPGGAAPAYLRMEREREREPSAGGEERPHDAVGAAGAWALTEALARALGRPLAALAAAAAPAGLAGAPQLWATALALAFLEARCETCAPGPAPPA
eukprot:tig00000624_g2659.t1